MELNENTNLVVALHARQKEGVTRTGRVMNGAVFFPSFPLETHLVSAAISHKLEIYIKEVGNFFHEIPLNIPVFVIL